MKELIKITDNGVDARELYEFLGIKHLFRNWISNAIRDYGFKKGKDFSYYFNESTGGRPSKEYVISITMAKELSMVAKTGQGKKARLYFIKCEDILKKNYAQRAIGIETRKTLTDAIQESGEDERMHGKGYSNYTRMVYDILGLSKVHKEWKLDKPDWKKNNLKFRDYLVLEDLKRLEKAEALIKPLLELDRQYSEIKDTLKPIFEKKEIR